MKLLIIILTLTGEPGAQPHIQVEYAPRCPTPNEARILQSSYEQEAEQAGLTITAQVNCYTVGRPRYM